MDLIEAKKALDKIIKYEFPSSETSDLIIFMDERGYINLEDSFWIH